MDVRWMCRLGVHGKWRSEESGIASVDVCGHCGVPRSYREFKVVQQERRLRGSLLRLSDEEMRFLLDQYREYLEDREEELNPATGF